MPADNSTLDDWLGWLEQLDPDRIELGLVRVQRVLRDLVPDFGATRSVLVGGTNGKGSTATLIEALARAAGLSTALYTSPHFLHFTERLCFGGEPVNETDMVRAFAQVNAVRGDTGLTYFEFTTLAAFWLIARKKPDLMVLEIGLGGRLDAVNAAPSDCSVVTTIGLEHTAWLGDTLEAIAAEKAGIARAGKPLIVGTDQCGDVFSDVAATTGAELIRVVPRPDDEPLYYAGEQMPFPGLPSHSARLALRVVETLGLRPSVSAVRRVLTTARMPGRLQRAHWQGVDWVLDVAHNPHAAAYVAERLGAEGPWSVVLGQLQDKDVSGVVQSLAPLTGGRPEAWYLAGLPGISRGLEVGELQRRGGEGLSGASLFEGVAGAVRAAAEGSRPVLVCGSFHTVTQALALLQESGQ